MSKISRVFGVALAYGLLSATLVFAAAYTEGSAGSGTISGKISFKGAVPPPKEFDLNRFPQPDFCGKFDSKDGKRIRHDVNVKDGALGDVVVYIEEIKSGKPFKTTETKIVAQGCRFLAADENAPSRMVTVVLNAKKTGKKAVIKVKNLDADPSNPKTAAGILHNPHGYDVKGPLRKTIFNKPVPKKGQEIALKVKKTWFKKKGTFMLIECDQHNYMNIWAVPIRNPYYAIASADGTYTIDGVPPGKYVLKAFHPALGFKTLKVDVSGATTANFEFGG